MFPFVKKIVISAGVFLVCAGSAHAETISPRRLLEVADLTDPVISPDGSSVAFRLEQASVVRNTFDVFWYVQALDGKSPPHRVADGGVLLHEFCCMTPPGVQRRAMPFGRPMDAGFTTVLWWMARCPCGARPWMVPARDP